MIPTLRSLLFALFGIPIVGLASTVTGALYVASLWFSLAALLVLLDWWFIGHRQVVWTRQHDEKLSLGAWNSVNLRASNGSGVRTLFRARDAVPSALLANVELLAGFCEPWSTHECTYAVFPTRRGDFALGPLNARYLGPLGLVWRQRQVLPPDSVKVYPNLRAIRTYEALARRGHLHEMGLRTSRVRGHGTEFERLRDYTPDDEIRRVNWKATARRHKLIAADYETERSQSVFLLLDSGRLMCMPVLQSNSGSNGPRNEEAHSSAQVTVFLSRLDHAVNAALLLAWVSQERGDRVGLLAFSDRIQRAIIPRSGHHQFLALIRELYNLEPELTEADYGVAIDYLSAHATRRSLVIIFTEIADSDAASALLNRLVYLKRRHLVVVVTLRDPVVERLARGSLLDSSSLYKRAVARSLDDERAEMLRRYRRADIHVLDVPADRVSPSLVNCYLDIKSRGAL